jgi:ribosomal protein L29
VIAVAGKALDKLTVAELADKRDQLAQQLADVRAEIARRHGEQ